MAVRYALCAPILAVLAGAGGPARAAEPATTVHRPPGRAPLRYRDEVFRRVKVTEGIRYGRAPDSAGAPVDLTLDSYEPAGDRARRRPAVVWLHSGGFGWGSSKTPDMVRMARAFAARGYVAVSINYRLLSLGACGGNPSPECFTAAFAVQHDAQAAVRWLRSHARRLRVDGSRIAIGGSSAGAISALLVGARPDDPGDSGNPGERSSVGAVISVSGGVPNPVDFDRGDAPMLFLHGDQDDMVPYTWAQTDARVLADAGVPTVLETLAGAGHLPWDRYGDRIVKHSAWFAYTQLRLARLPSP